MFGRQLVSDRMDSWQAYARRDRGARYCAMGPPARQAPDGGATAPRYPWHAAHGPVTWPPTWASTSRKLVAWIKGGELSAINVATKPGGRPRYRITPEALDAFLAVRSVLPTPKASRRRAKGGYQYQYF